MNHSEQRYSERVILSLLAFFGRPRSLLDLGCGDGTMIGIAARLGVQVIGVDIEAGGNIIHDLRTPLDLHCNFDMILCLETAEHLPERSAITLCDTIARHRHANSILVFSAAQPNQNGDAHLNLKPPTWWRDMLYETGKWSFRKAETAALQLILSQTAGPLANWLVPNIQVF